MFAITERLLLRPGWAEDAPALARAIGEEAIVRNLSQVPWPYAVRDAEAFLIRAADPLRPRFLITLRTDGRLIGGMGLHGDGEPEIGYWIARAWWGQGIATEAAGALVDLVAGSLRIPRLHARHAIDNPASGRVLAKLGFVAAGSGRLHSVARGGEMEVRKLVRDMRAADPLAAQLAA